MSNRKKVLGICVSGKENGNSSILLNELLKPSREKGYDVEEINIGKLDILPCNGCFACMNPKAAGKCVLKDDLEFIKGKIKEADAIAVASPSYCLSIPSRLQAIMERAANWSINEISNNGKRKYGAAVSVASGTYSLLNTHLSLFLALCKCNTIGQFTMPNAFNKGEVLLYPSKIKHVSKLGETLVESIDKDQYIRYAYREDEENLRCMNCYADTLQIKEDGRIICPVCRMELKRTKKDCYSTGFSRISQEGALIYIKSLKNIAMNKRDSDIETGNRLKAYLNNGVLPDADFSMYTEDQKEPLQWNDEALAALDCWFTKETGNFFKNLIEIRAREKGIHCITKEVFMNLN